MANTFSDDFNDMDAAIFALGTAAGNGSAYAVDLLMKISEGEGMDAALAHTSLAAVYAPVSEFRDSGYHPKHKPDYDTWIMHLERAAQLGSPHTLYWYGSSLINGGADFPADAARGEAMVIRAAHAGLAAAAISLVRFYFEGRSLPKDHQKAAEWIAKALELNPYDFEIDDLREIENQLEK